MVLFYIYCELLSWTWKLCLVQYWITVTYHYSIVHPYPTQSQKCNGRHFWELIDVTMRQPCHSTVGGKVTLIDTCTSLRLDSKNLYELDMESVNNGTPLKCFWPCIGLEVYIYISNHTVGVWTDPFGLEKCYPQCSNRRGVGTQNFLPNWAEGSVETELTLMPTGLVGSQSVGLGLLFLLSPKESVGLSLSFFRVHFNN